jgi:hypothetical protein
MIASHASKRYSSKMVIGCAERKAKRTRALWVSVASDALHVVQHIL